MKAVSVTGARPQFIKCPPVSRELRRLATEVLVHTGQHYEDSMSGVFFRELDLRRPDYHLGVGSGSHGWQTGEMLKKIEEILVKEEPDILVVYGDTNSTLAGALATAKLHNTAGNPQNEASHLTVMPSEESPQAFVGSHPPQIESYCAKLLCHDNSTLKAKT